MLLLAREKNEKKEKRNELHGITYKGKKMEWLAAAAAIAEDKAYWFCDQNADLGLSPAIYPRIRACTVDSHQGKNLEKRVD